MQGSKLALILPLVHGSMQDVTQSALKATLLSEVLNGPDHTSLREKRKHSGKKELEKNRPTNPDAVGPFSVKVLIHANIYLLMYGFSQSFSQSLIHSFNHSLIQLTT